MMMMIQCDRWAGTTDRSSQYDIKLPVPADAAALSGQCSLRHTASPCVPVCIILPCRITISLVLVENNTTVTFTATGPGPLVKLRSPGPAAVTVAAPARQAPRLQASALAPGSIVVAPASGCLGHWQSDGSRSLGTPVRDLPGIGARFPPPPGPDLQDCRRRRRRGARRRQSWSAVKRARWALGAFGTLHNPTNGMAAVLY
jgi:hypothetical protein